MSTRRWLAALAVSVACLCRPTVAEALPDRVLQNVVPYDLTGARTLDALTELGREERSPDVQERAAARFVRTLAYTDLWLLARVLHDDGVAGRVAQALATEQAALPRTLSSLLDSLTGSDHALADARAAISAEHRLPVIVGPRTASVALTQVMAALKAQAPRAPLSALAELIDDPCAHPVAPCGSDLSALDMTGRRAFAALERAQRALVVVGRDAADPFVTPLSGFLQEARDSLSHATLFPGRRLDDIASAPGDDGDAAFGKERFLVVQVKPTGFALWTTPRIVTATGHAPQIDAPALGFVTPVVVPLPVDLPPYVKAVPELKAALAGVLEACKDCSVLVAAEPQAEGHLIARSVLSARAAGREPKALIVAGARTRAFPIVSVSALDATKAAGLGDYRVQVRRGGFEVQRGGTSTSLPRVKNDAGFAFDYEGLRKRVENRSKLGPALTFMSDVDAASIMATAGLLSRRDVPLTLLLP